jgi:hypothetical protein
LQPELEGRYWMDGIPSDQSAVSVVATKAVSPIPGFASYRYAVNQLLKSVVREIRTQHGWSLSGIIRMRNARHTNDAGNSPSPSGRSKRSQKFSNAYNVANRKCRALPLSY